MTRIIQLVGALLGTLFGFGLGLLILERAGDVVSAPNRPAFLMAVVAASLLFGVRPPGELPTTPPWPRAGSAATEARSAAPSRQADTRRKGVVMLCSGRPPATQRGRDVRQPEEYGIARRAQPPGVRDHAAWLSALRSARLRSFGSRWRLRNRTALGVTSTSSSSSM